MFVINTGTIFTGRHRSSPVVLSQQINSTHTTRASTLCPVPTGVRAESGHAGARPLPTVLAPGVCPLGILRAEGQLKNRHLVWGINPEHSKGSRIYPPGHVLSE